MPEADVVTQRINAIGDVIVKIITPFLVIVQLYLQSQLSSKIDSAKADVQAVAVSAAENASDAAKAAKVVSNKVQGIELTQDQIQLLAQANLKQWKAYNTKAPEDMEEAHELTRAAESYEARPAATPPPTP